MLITVRVKGLKPFFTSFLFFSCVQRFMKLRDICLHHGKPQKFRTKVQLPNWNQRRLFIGLIHYFRVTILPPIAQVHCLLYKHKIPLFTLKTSAPNLSVTMARSPYELSPSNQTSSCACCSTHDVAILC